DDEEQDGVGPRRVDDEQHSQDHGPTDDGGVDQLLRREQYRFAGYPFGELEPRQYRPADGDAADEDGEEEGDGGDGVRVGVGEVLDPPDQQRRQTARTVEQRHGLGHLGHLDAPGQYRADGPTDEYAHQDPHVVDVAVDQGGDDRD